MRLHNQRLPLWSHLILLALAFAMLAAIAACGDIGEGGGSGNYTGDDSSGLITIDNPTSESSYTEYCNSVHLEGEAFISSTWSRCCSGSAEDTGVTVTWENKATGEIGNATQYVRICYLFGTPFLCDHLWKASVPLTLGENFIVVTASDPAGKRGNDSITVTKPEYTYYISGEVVNPNGIGLGWHGAWIEMHITGENIDKFGATSLDGSYGLACIPNGSYTITPRSNLDYNFEPESQVVFVNSGNVSGVDFVAEAYIISGYIRRENGTGVSGISVKLSDTDLSVSYPSTDDEGFYRFAVPNGTYAITPYEWWLPVYIFNPPSTTVTIDSDDVTNVNFTALQ
jgi:hypothetical protein